MSTDILNESQEMLDRNNDRLNELKKVLEEQEGQMAEIEDGLKKLGLSLEGDLPIDKLTADQRAQLDALQAEVERIEKEMTAQPSKGMKPSRMNKVMI